MRGYRSWLGPLSYYSTVPLSRSALLQHSVCMSSSVAAKKIGDDILSRVEAAAAATMVSVTFDPISSSAGVAVTFLEHVRSHFRLG